MYSEIHQNKNSFKEFCNRLFHRRTKRLLTDREQEFQKYLDFFTYFSILFLLCGIMFSIFSFSLKSCGVIMGIFFLLNALIHGYFFTKRRNFSIFRFCVIPMFMFIILGIVPFCLKLSQMDFYFIVLGIYVLLGSIEHFLLSFSIFRLHDQTFFLFLIFSILSIVISILVFLNPFEQLTYAEVLGVFLILYHILRLSLLSLLQKKISGFVSIFD